MSIITSANVANAIVKLVAVDARSLELWRKMIEGLKGKLRGQYVPEHSYDEALRWWRAAAECWCLETIETPKRGSGGISSCTGS